MFTVPFVLRYKAPFFAVMFLITQSFMELVPFPKNLTAAEVPAVLFKSQIVTFSIFQLMSSS